MYTDGKLSWSHAPVTLSPSPYPRSSFEYVQQIQPLLNKMIDNISRDKNFLTTCLAPIAESDDFVARLLQIFESQPESRILHGINLGIHRSDYMLNNDHSQLHYPQPASSQDSSDSPPLQIEINTIASSFGCLSHQVGQLHRYLLTRNAGSDELKSVLQAVDIPEYMIDDPNLASQCIPENGSIRALAQALSVAHFLYGDKEAIVLFVVQPGERNQADQRLLEAELWKGHNVKVEFVTLEQVAHRARLDGHPSPIENGPAQPLLIRLSDNSPTERHVSVVYYRAGYSPTDYPTETQWDARVLMENSLAIKCPSVAYQLAGTKKVQQALCEGSCLDKFLPDPIEAELVRRCFAGQYSLGREGDAAADAAVQAAIQDGSRWVLKPQREGGGNNFYGAELSEFLKAHAGKPLLSAYVLMQRIFPKPQKATFLRNGSLEVLDSISELGIYGTFMGDGSDVPVINDCVGYLLRTKPVGTDEGGVATGYSVLNSIVLTE